MIHVGTYTLISPCMKEELRIQKGLKSRRTQRSINLTFKTNETNSRILTTSKIKTNQSAETYTYLNKCLDGKSLSCLVGGYLFIRLSSIPLNKYK